MDQSIFKKLLPHGVAILIFIIVAAIVSKTSLQSGMTLNQSDITGWKGMAQQSFEYKAEHGHYPLWITNMFGGMPGYQVAMDGPWHPSGILHTLFTLGLPRPMNFFFLASICFYFLALCLRVRPYIAIIGALGFAYCTYNPIIIGAGHETKMLALAYLPALLGSILLVYQRKYLIGFIMVTIFTMMEISMNHQQISYYFFIVAGIMTMAYIIKWVRSKELPHLGKSLGIVLVSGMLGIMVNALALLPVYDFVKYSKRGGQLILDDSKQSNEAEKTKGLSVDYAFQWSYGKAETLTLMFPGTQGYGAKGAELGEKSHVAKYLTEKLNQPEEQATQMAQSFSGSLYWGDQPFTEGPVYLGAIICFLFIFAMVYLKNFHKWWILASCIVAVMMAWGKNFPGFNEFIFNYLPLYNKFRAPTMTLIIPQLLFPLAGILVLQQLLDSKEDMPALNKILKTTAIATISVFAAVILVYMSFDYKNENRSRTEAFNKMIASKTQNMNVQYAQLNSQYPAQKDNQVYESLVSNTQGNTEVAQGILGAIRADRSSVFGKDIFRSFIFVALAFGLLVLCIRKTVSSNVMLTGIALLTFVDLYMVDINFLNETNYIEKDAYETEAFPLSEADKVILQDKDPNYRVLNTMGGDPYQESRTSYYHKSIGGYSPAKLGIYDDLITYQLSGSPNRQVLNMLNTKYIIQQNPQDQKPMPIPNTEALGNVWFVKEIKFVKGASAEMKALTHFNAKDTAIVDETFQKVASIKTVFDSTATIRQVKFDNDAIQYESVSGTPQTAVFSEIYYPGGWNAYIDGKAASYFKANYVLRSMIIPAGKHNIDFRFEPKSYQLGAALTKYSSFIIVLILTFGIFYAIKSYRQGQKKAV